MMKLHEGRNFCWDDLSYSLHAYLAGGINYHYNKVCAVHAIQHVDGKAMFRMWAKMTGNTTLVRLPEEYIVPAEPPKGAKDGWDVMMKTMKGVDFHVGDSALTQAAHEFHQKNHQQLIIE